MNKKINKRKKGFTLIELIIVLAIMAIIAAIAIPNFTAVRNNSKSKADKQSIQTIKRTTLMLVSDETIKPATVNMTATFSVASGVAYNVTDDTATSAKEGFTAPEKTALEAALAEVKAPQGTGAVNYRVTIAATSGDVTVTTLNSSSGTIETTD